ncbi:hypothetical protein PSHT_12031 [Puccinia striiformis]|uniref:Uncharacterized protein n=1 Tax=Puccinia striiformis TaxID=27350 RepID=A0A2S4UZF7_9BASI|nr:hypothetical protein PSHT_12031 [Puccinia striiformis]
MELCAIWLHQTWEVELRNGQGEIVSQLTNVSVNSIECTKYYVDDKQKTICMDCTLNQHTPSISNCASNTSAKHTAKGSHPLTTSNGAGMTMWLAWD